MPDPAFDAATPHVSRVYDYLLGGELIDPGVVLVPDWRPDPR